ncbi:MAG: hypothetical protein M3301_08255 [Chloroflexota bacterium]|nr:hypothetical protein [Chloroflexota bacterium]
MKERGVVDVHREDEAETIERRPCIPALDPNGQARIRQLPNAGESRLPVPLEGKGQNAVAKDRVASLRIRAEAASEHGSTGLTVASRATRRA